MTKKNLNIVKVQFNGTTQEEIKEEKKLFASAYNANNLKDCKQSNAYVLKLDKNLLIVDCDDKQSLKYVNNLIEKYEIDPVFTKSISNKMKINKYKYHFYFKNNLNIENNKTGINGGKLDLLVNSLSVTVLEKIAPSKGEVSLVSSLEKHCSSPSLILRPIVSSS
jgi:hypothetical protein